MATANPSRPLARRLLPVTDWLPSYRRAWLRADVPAGLTLLGLLVPETMAYAQIAGARPQAGLYAAVAGLVLYALFGTCRQLAVAPTSTAAVMTSAVVAPLAAAGTAQASTLIAAVALATGLILLLAGVARLGFVAAFLSKPVISGFVFGLALVIIVRQLPRLLGLPRVNGDFFRQLWRLAAELSQTSMATLAVGLGALAVMLVLGHWGRRLPGALAAMVLGIVVAAAFGLDQHGVAIIGAVPHGFPRPAVPSLTATQAARTGASAFGIALVVVAEGLTSGRALATRHGAGVDADQELIAFGFANAVSGFLGGIVVSGSLSASAANESAGARSPLAGAAAAVLMIVTIVALTPLFRDLPEAVLAAVVIVAVARLLMVRELRRYRRLRSADLVLAVVALLGVLVFGILPGLGGAVALSLVFLIYRSSRPNGAVLGRVPGERTYSDVSRHPENEQFPGLLIFRVDGQLFFANAALVQDRVRDLVAEQRPRALVMDMEVSTDLDTTSADMLSELVSELHEERVSVLFARVRDPVLDMFRRSGLLHKVNAACVFPTVDDAVRSFQAGDAPLRPVSPPGAVTGHMEREPGE